MATSRELYSMLRASASFEVVGEPAESTLQLRFMGRVRTRAQSKLWANGVVRQLLRAAKTAPWSIDISRQYFVRGPDDELIWGWRVILQAKDAVVTHIDDVIDHVRIGASALSRPVGEVMEMPLVGSSATRNALINGKGASNIKEAR